MRSLSNFEAIAPQAAAQVEGGLRFAAPDPNLTPKELAALLREREKITRQWLKANGIKKGG
jgi:hypothetical protein